MYLVEIKDYGLLVQVRGSLGVEDAQVWLQDIKDSLEKVSAPFGIIVDVREAKIFLPQTQEVIKSAIEVCAKGGMERAAVILNNAVSTLQARRLARESGTATWQRFLDASYQEDWEEKALQWLINGIDP